MADTPDLGLSNCSGTIWNALELSGLPELISQILGPLWTVLALYFEPQSTKKYTKDFPDQSLARLANTSRTSIQSIQSNRSPD
jgi:hypothetical protein